MCVCDKGQKSTRKGEKPTQNQEEKTKNFFFLFLGQKNRQEPLTMMKFFGFFDFFN